MLRGRVLTPPKNLPVRPTTDIARESLFNILNNQFYWDEISVLDLFSGTGAVSIEFASRGVESITSIDNNHQCVSFLKKTAEKFEIQDQIKAIKRDVFQFLKSDFRKYDIIFADPPFDLDQEEYNKIVDAVEEKELLKEGGFLILEHSDRRDFSSNPNFKELRKYGKVHFSFFEKEINEEAS